MHQIYIVQMRLPANVELLLKQECLKHNNDESLHSGESRIYLKGFVIYEKFTMLVPYFAYHY